MASRASTPSEGEIVEAKANQSRSPSSSPVNRQSRRVLYSRSPSPTASARDSRRRRSRSRSPYRERGAKRRHDDDHYSRRDRDDPRRFKVHYEERRSGRNERGLSDKHFEDRRRGHARRSRSRSPPRFHDRIAGRDRRARSRERASQGARKSPSEQLVSNRKNVPSATAISNADAELNNNQAKQDPASEAVKDADSLQLNVQQESLDVEALREQKRKKWEAIRAKHRSQPSNLLVQAIDASADQTARSATPSHSNFGGSQMTSELGSVPGTPRSGSSRSPTPTMDFSRDSDLANGHAQEVGDLKEEEPSAADYDPTMDMREDKMRHDQRLQGEDAAAVAVTTSPERDMLMPGKAIETVENPSKDEFDMFADNDEEDVDMFAPLPSGPKSDSRAGLPASASKALNVNTIDDWDDEHGYYKVILGELLDGRYHVQSNLGKGMFSAVVRAKDQVTQKLVAIKLIRSNETMRKAAAKEIAILEKLTQADPEDKRHVVRLERSFEHKGHLCMVFENLNENLREVLKKFGRDVGIDLQAVRVYTQQIFKGLGLLRKCNILHADLKPDNILVNDRRDRLKLCDLGSASDASENEITPYLVSRFYRAPEIILGMPYDFAIDTWSIGCTLFELYTGKILFAGRSNNQMLRSIMECRGRFSTKMLRKSEFAAVHFDDAGIFRSVEKDKVTGKDVVRNLNFLKPTRDLRARLMGPSRDPELSLFLDLLDKCLALNPERRITPADALKHPFLTRLKA